MMVFCVKEKKLANVMVQNAGSREGIGAPSQKIFSAKSRAAQPGGRQGEELAHYP